MDRSKQKGKTVIKNGKQKENDKESENKTDLKQMKDTIKTESDDSKTDTRDIKSTKSTTDTETKVIKDGDKNIGKDDPEENSVKVTESKSDETKHLDKILKEQSDNLQETKKNIIQKYIPTFDDLNIALAKFSSISSQTIKRESKLFRLFEPRVQKIFDARGGKTIINRWYWHLKKDEIPVLSYDVRMYFAEMYKDVVFNMSDYIILRDLAVDNTYSMSAGKIVDDESFKIVKGIFTDEQANDVDRAFITSMKQEVSAANNRITYPAILHRVDYEFNQFFLASQQIVQLTSDDVINLLPAELRRDMNYVFSLDVTFKTTDRYVPYNLQQDRIHINELETLWDAFVTSFYVHTKNNLPMLTELESAETKITDIAQNLRLSATEQQSESVFLTGINSQAANDAFQIIVASMLSGRTMNIHFSSNNYLSLITGMYLMTIVPYESLQVHQVNALQLSIVQNILAPAYGIPRMQFTYDGQTPFQVIYPRINNQAVRQWLHYVTNANRYRRIQRNGVELDMLHDLIVNGRCVVLLTEALINLTRAPFTGYDTTTRRTITQALRLVSDRSPQISDLTRLIAYNHNLLQRCIVMSQHHIQTLTMSDLQLTSVTALTMLIGNTPSIPTPNQLVEYLRLNINFLHNYNEKLDDYAAITMALHRFNLYHEKILSVITSFLKDLQIFQETKVSQDIMYRLRERIRRLPVEQRRQRAFNLLMNNSRYIAETSSKVSQGVVLLPQEVPLVHDPQLGFANIRRNADGMFTLTLEDIHMRGRYDLLTQQLLDGNPVALVGSMSHNIQTDVLSLVAKIDNGAFIPMIKEKDIKKLSPVLYVINEDSENFYLLSQRNYQPRSSTQLIMREKEIYSLRDSFRQLSSNIHVQVLEDVLNLISYTRIDKDMWVAEDGNKIMMSMTV